MSSIEIKGFTEHALERFIQRIGWKGQRQSAMNKLDRFSKTAYCVRGPDASGRSRLESKKVYRIPKFNIATRRYGPETNNFRIVFICQGGFVQTVFLRKLTKVEEFAEFGPVGISGGSNGDEVGLTPNPKADVPEGSIQARCLPAAKATIARAT